jgi:hypothetical protein
MFFGRGKLSNVIKAFGGNIFAKIEASGLLCQMGRNRDVNTSEVHLERLRERLGKQQLQLCGA